MQCSFCSKAGALPLKCCGLRAHNECWQHWLETNEACPACDTDVPLRGPCVVCLEHVELSCLQEDFIQVEEMPCCKQIIHTSCLSECLKHKSTCPVCRSSLGLSRYLLEGYTICAYPQAIPFLLPPR